MARRKRFPPQRFDVPAAFKLLAAHLAERKDVVRFLAVTAAMERWVQFEAAALIDQNRDALGIGGEFATGLPRWWIACEHKRRDLWLRDQGDPHVHVEGGGVGVEFKAVHNNKNYVNRVASIRADLTTDAALSDGPDWGVIVATYVQYARASGSLYWALRDVDRTPLTATRFWKRLHEDLRSKDARWGETTPLDVVDHATVASLRDAHYVDPSVDGCEVRLLLVQARRDE